MAEQRLSKAEHDKLCRMICLLLNRSMMYTADHPHIQEGINNLHDSLSEVLSCLNTMALILNQGQLFLDEDPVDSRINTSRIVSVFKKIGIQSISFSNGITPDEISVFIHVFTSPNKYPDSDAISEGLSAQGVDFLKINHVFYKKVTKDDEVVARDDRIKKPLKASDEAGPAFKKEVVEKLLAQVLTDDTRQALSMKNLMENPAGLSQNMLDAENQSMQAVESGAHAADVADMAGDAQAVPPGAALLHQVQVLSDDVRENMDGDSQVNMLEVADAVFEMKRQLVMGIESQKALNQAYANEEQILDQVNELADDVLVKLVKDEYQQGAIAVPRLAQILRRLVPEPGELKRLLPKIKAVLLAEGMPVSEYLEMVNQLGKELEGEGLSHMLREAAESVGVDGAELIEEIRKQPEKAAELMAIAAEVRKGAGDEEAFTEMLVNYVEQLGDTMRSEAAAQGDAESDAQACQMISDIGSGLAAQLKNMNFSDDALLKMEERINARIEKILEKSTIEGGAPQQAASAAPSRKERTLLQMMEQSRGDNEELGHLIRHLREEADADKLDENSFEQIYASLMKQEAARREQEANRQMPLGVLKTSELKFYLEKELLRAKRHDLYVSTLAFSIINVRPQRQLPADKKIKKSELFNVAYHRLVDIVRATDMVGELKQDTMVVVLPMARKADADLALKRITKALHESPFDIDGVPLSVVIAGSVTAFRPDERPKLDTYIKTMLYNLDHVSVRVKNIHNL